MASPARIWKQGGARGIAKQGGEAKREIDRERGVVGEGVGGKGRVGGKERERREADKDRGRQTQRQRHIEREIARERYKHAEKKALCRV